MSYFNNVARLIVWAMACSGLFVSPVSAVTYYWDTNGSTLGAASVGNTAPGTWGADQFWTTSITGITTPTITNPTSLDVLIFSAGSDATGTYTVNVSGTGVANRIYVEEGNVTLNGNIGVTPPAPVQNVPTTSAVGAGVGRKLVVTGSTTIYGDFGYDVNPGSEIHLQGGIQGAYAVRLSGNSNNSGAIFIGASNYTTLADVPYAAAVVATGNGALGNNLATTTFGTNTTLGFQGGFDYTDAKAISIIGTGAGRGAIRNYSGDNRFAGAINLTGATTIAVDADSLELYGALTSGVAAGLTKNGVGNLILTGNDTRGGVSTVAINAGTLTYGGTNTFTGSMTIGGVSQTSRAKLAIDFGLAGSATNNILNNVTNSSALLLNGGDVEIIGSATGANSQRFLGLTLNAGGASKLIATANGHNLVTTFGTLTRNTSSTIDFTLPGGAQSAANGITFTTAALTNSILPYGTVGEANWATRDGGTGNILAYAGYGIDSFAGGGATNVDVSAGSHTPSAFTVNSLRFNGSTNLTLDSSAKSQLSAGAMLVTANGNATINGGGAAALAHTVSSGEFIVHNYGQLNMLVPIANGGSGSASVATFAGTGTTQLGASNTFGGAMNVTAGTVQLTGTGSLATNSIIVGSGATFEVDGALALDTLLTNNGYVEFGSGPRTIGRLAGTATSAETVLNGTLTLDNDTTAASYVGVITGSGGIVKQGLATQTLSPVFSNTFTGGIHIQEGTIAVGSPSGDVSNPNTPTISISPDGIIVEQGAELLYSAGGNRFWVDEVTLRGGKLRDNVSSNNQHHGNIILEQDSFIEKNAANFTIVGSITGAGGFEKLGAAILTLASDSNTYEGPTTVSAGTMNVNATSSLGNTSALTVQNLNVDGLTISNDVRQNVQLTLSNAAQTVGSFGGTIADKAIYNVPLNTNPSVFVDISNRATLSLGSTTQLTINQTQNRTFEGNIIGGGTNARLILGTDSTAALTLTGANTYAGGTIIDGGTLLVSNTTGSGTGAGSVVVNSGGTLGGTGVIAGTVLVNNGGALAPGASAGALTINGTGGVSFQPNAAFQVEVGGTAPGTSYDQLIVLNGAFLAGELEVSLIDGFFPSINDEFVILSAGSIVGTFTNAPTEGSTVTMSWGSFDVSYLGDAVTLLNFQPAPIPEPSSLVLLGLGLLGVARRRRTVRRNG